LAGLEKSPEPAREEPEDGRPHCQWRFLEMPVPPRNLSTGFLKI
jgi:hypothetical protein